MKPSRDESSEGKVKGRNLPCLLGYNQNFHTLVVCPSYAKIHSQTSHSTCFLQGMHIEAYNVIREEIWQVCNIYHFKFLGKFHLDKTI